MSMEDNADKGISILSFDSGGPRTYSQLLLIKHFTSRLAVESDTDEGSLYPADYFDLMGGVGFGGIAAIMLGHLLMTIDQALDALLKIACTVFPGDSDRKFPVEVNMMNLRKAIEDLFQAQEIPVGTKMNDKTRQSPKCKVVIYAATTSNVSHPHIFRNYPHRGSSLNPTIIDALCATMGGGSLFAPVTIKRRNFVGAPLGASNPTRELLKEACSAFGADTRVAQIISLGAGCPPDVSLESTDLAEMVGDLMKHIIEDCEKVDAELSTRLFAVDAYVRLNVPIGLQRSRLDDWRGLGAIESQTNVYIERPDVVRVLERSVRSLQQKDGAATLGMINFSTTVQVAVKVAPAVCSHFVMRQQEWDTMAHHLITLPSKNQKIFCITGMGGCGKTQLVSYFLQEKGAKYTHAVFVDASSAPSLKADLQAWARSRGIGHEQDVWEDAIRILASDPYAGKWILVLDNADNPELDLAPFLPRCYNGTVIVTSRNRDMGYLSNTHHLELGEMRVHEALSTLLLAARRQGPLSSEELSGAHALAKTLGYLAVALVQAGTYCYQSSTNQHGVSQPFTFGQYIELFSVQRGELMKRGISSSLDEYQLGAYTAFDISYQALPNLAKDFLHFVSSFHHSNISLDMFSIAAREGFTDPRSFIPRPEHHLDLISHLKVLLCIGGNWDEKRVHEIIHTLRSFSLVSASSLANTVFLHLHPLVHTWARDSLPSDPQQPRKMAIQVITSCCRDDNPWLYRYIVPHILDILGQTGVPDTHINDLMAIGGALKSRGYYRKASGLVEAALEQMTNYVDQSAEKTLEVTTRLAEIYWQDGRLGDAEKLDVAVWEERKRLLGIEHPDIIEAVGDLAETYHSQGRWREAEELEVGVLEQRKRVLGTEHPDTIMAAANLAATYSRQGRWSEAEKLDITVLNQRRKLLGMEHPDTVIASANLAETYRFQGRWSEAETLEMDVLERRKKLLGMEHPDTIRATANLASTYSRQGRWSEAEKLDVGVLDQRKKLLGMDHPDTIKAAGNLAETYSSLGRWVEAEELEVGVMERRKRVLGLDHPDTIGAAANLAATYSAQGRWSEAEKLELDVLERQKTILGIDHPSTITASANLARTYCYQGRWSEAEELEAGVLEQRERVLGTEHPDTISAAGNLASTYSKQGRWSEAEKLGMVVLDRSKRVFGIDHPDTTSAASHLAEIYWKQGRHNEAGILEVDVLEQRKRLLGLEHPDTIVAAANLADTYYNQGLVEKAAQLLAPTVELGVKVLGQQHPNTHSRMSNCLQTSTRS